MKFLLLLSLFLIFQFSYSVYGATDIWKMGNHFLEFTKDESQNILISKSCYNRKCDALKILKIISFKKINSTKLEGGKNPGSILCTDIAGAQIIYLRDLNGNDNSFCQFKDQSMVSASTLSTFARKNDEK